MPPQLTRIEVQGFRSFGTVRQTPDLAGPIAVFWAGNSQGKTSFSEALEFLFSGQIARRDLLASAKDEFTEALRNVHMPSGALVAVEASIICPDGQTRKLCRTLVEDYRRGNAQGCTSTLTIDGVAANDNQIESLLGIRLSQHPVRAPILGQHNLAYLFSASPADRAAYFRAILDTQDLEDFRNDVQAMEAALVAPASPEMNDLLEVELLADAGPGRVQIRKSPKPETLRARLESASSALLTSIGLPVPKGLAAQANAIEAELTTRRSKTFPVDLLRRSAFAPWAGDAAKLKEAADKFLEERQKVDAESQRTLDLFKAALAIPAHPDHPHGDDCPLCGTVDAFGADRVAFVREQVRASEAFSSASASFLGSLRSSILHCDTLAQSLSKALPRFMREQRGKRRAAEFTVAKIKELVPSDGRLEEWLSAVRALARADRALQLRIRAARKQLDHAQKNSQEWSDVGGLIAAINDIASAQESFVQQLTAYEGPARLVGEGISATVDQNAQTSGWESLIRLARNPDALWHALRLDAAHRQKVSDIKKAIREIDMAIGKVTDEKFAELSDEVKFWWDRLRPEENTFFSGVQRRSDKARRTVDLKAGMSVKDDRANPKFRDAVAVFSQSQLHCLGLALFLAKAVQEKAGFILLDDPVLTSDEDYRPNFTSSVLEGLLDKGIQVLICTQDHKTYKDIGDRWLHRNAQQFIMVRNDAVTGTEIRKENDDLATMIARARPATKSQDPALRKDGARQIREIIERFSKCLLVKDRKVKGDNGASITQYDGKNFGTYSNNVYALLTKDAADPGKLRSGFSDVTSGSHDDAPPTTATLARALGDLNRLKKDYLD